MLSQSRSGAVSAPRLSSDRMASARGGGCLNWLRNACRGGTPRLLGRGSQVPPRLLMGAGRPLEPRNSSEPPGTYYVGVYNSDTTQTTGYTIDSRGIGAGMFYPIAATLTYSGGSATITNLAPREAKYFKVTIPANTPSWELTLAPTVGEMLLVVRRDTVPDFTAGIGGDAGSTSDQEVKMQKDRPERYVMLPQHGQDLIPAGDYYVAVVSEGMNPPDSSTIGMGNSSGTLTSVGLLPVTNLGAASVAGLTQPASLFGGQIKAYQFTVPAGTASLEVRLDNRVGNPWFSLVEGTRLPYPPYYSDAYGNDGGEGGTQDSTIQTLVNPTPGTPVS